MNYQHILSNHLSPELVIIIVGMLPIAELRGAIPLAIGGYHMEAGAAFFWAVLGNIIPPIGLIFLLEGTAKFLSEKFTVWKRFFNWLFARTRRRAQDKINRYGVWGLFLLVAIPLPMTGGWTGALAAFLFGIERRKAIPVIILGILAAGIIVLTLTTGVANLSKQ
jgi:uncharacterized membrane protein